MLDGSRRLLGGYDLTGRSRPVGQKLLLMRSRSFSYFDGTLKSRFTKALKFAQILRVVLITSANDSDCIFGYLFGVRVQQAPLRECYRRDRANAFPRNASLLSNPDERASRVSAHCNIPRRGLRVVPIRGVPAPFKALSSLSTSRKP